MDVLEEPDDVRDCGQLCTVHTRRTYHYPVGEEVALETLPLWCFQISRKARASSMIPTNKLHLGYSSRDNMEPPGNEQMRPPSDRIHDIRQMEEVIPTTPRIRACLCLCNADSYHPKASTGWARHITLVSLSRLNRLVASQQTSIRSAFHLLYARGRSNKVSNNKASNNSIRPLSTHGGKRVRIASLAS